MLEIVQSATNDGPEEMIARYDSDAFLGELNMLNRQAVYRIARAVDGGPIHRIPPVRFRQLMADRA